MPPRVYELVRPGQTWRDLDLGVDSGIGGSTAAAMLGVCPPSWAGATMWGVWAAANGQIRAVGGNPIFARGHILEGPVLAIYAHRTGLHLRRGLALQDPDEPWRLASPDGLVFEADGDGDPIGGVDAKTDGHWDAGSQWADDGTDVLQWSANVPMPTAYAVQGYWYLGITGLPWWDFAVLSPSKRRDPLAHAAAVALMGCGLLTDAIDLCREWAAAVARDEVSEPTEFRIVRLHRDEATQTEIVDRVRHLRARYLIGDESPPLEGTDDCLRWLRGQLAEPRVEMRDATPTEATAAGVYVDARAAESAAIAAKKGAHAVLLEACRDFAGLHVPGGGKIKVGSSGRLTVSGFKK